MIKLALIGLGSIAEHQINALRYVGGMQLTDVMDNDPAKAALLTPNVNFHHSLENLITYSAADLYLIATPSHTRMRYTEKVEKPTLSSWTGEGRRKTPV